jgi:hypothetical protein
VARVSQRQVRRGAAVPSADRERSTAQKRRSLRRRLPGVGDWEWAPDSRRIYFITADTVDEAEKLRREKDFTVDIYNMETPLSSLWSIDLDPVRVTRLTRDHDDIGDPASMSRPTAAGSDSVAQRRSVTGATSRRRASTPTSICSRSRRGSIERLTDNEEVGESGPDFSPDGRFVAFSAPDDLTRYTMSNRRVYIRPVAERGGQFRKLGSSFDGDVGVGFWSPDSRTIYFNTGVRATRQLMALDIERDQVRQVTNERAARGRSRRRIRAYC